MNVPTPLQVIEGAEEVAALALDLALRILGPDRAKSLLDAKAVAAAEAAADAAEDVKFPEGA
jgi:hypothetical protein